MTTRAVEKLIERYIKVLKLDANVTMHSLRVTALTTARGRGSDIIDLQEFAEHADPRTTLRHRLNARLSSHLWFRQFGLCDGNGPNRVLGY